MSLMQCKNSKIQNAINNIFLSCCILTWIECLIFSFVFVVVGMYMYNLILITAVSALLTDMKKHLFCKMFVDK